jgi:hypothetical protein
VQVVQAIGAPESEPFNFSNPKKIDGDGAIALVEAATALDVDQYVMVTSLGTAKIGFPAGARNLAPAQAQRWPRELRKAALQFCRCRCWMTVFNSRRLRCSFCNVLPVKARAP